MTPQGRTRLRTAGLILAAYTLLGLFLTGYRVFTPLAEGRPFSLTLLVDTAFREFTGAYGAALFFPVFLWFCRRYPIVAGTGRRRIPAYVLLITASSVALTLLMWGTRSAKFALAGARYHDGVLALRFPMEFFPQAVHFITVIGFIHFFLYHRRTRDREVQAAQLESQLARARLQNLQAQLHPHFLFNTLNAISSLMYHDTAAADRLMTRLSDLLRATVANPAEPETTLDRELEWTDAYLGIMQERFSDRLTVHTDVAPGTGDLLVPTLLLQPLVENAIRHGVGRRARPGTVEIVATRQGGVLRLEVRDDGPGLPPGGIARPGGSGVGLANTAARLRHLYGSEGRMTFASGDRGGLTVAIEIPARSARPRPGSAT